MRKLQKVVITAATVGGLVALGSESAHAAGHSGPRHGSTQPPLVGGLVHPQLVRTSRAASLFDGVLQAPRQEKRAPGGRGLKTVKASQQKGRADVPAGAVNQLNQAIGVGRANQGNQAVGADGRVNQLNQAIGVGQVNQANQANQAVGTTGQVNQVNQAVGTTGQVNQANQVIGAGQAG
ncbi:hypothetical protein ABZ920_08185 [Streptomyces sp. NPDC046831]|uniref:hypothetical protein n=1 Tax=Streptomyces sp. NPDC046831 TaxID=3154805 RepID=UPI0033E241F1